MQPTTFLRDVQRAPWYRGQLAHVEHLSPRPATPGYLDHPLAPPVQRALERLGAWPLYSHQAQAIAALDRGEHVMVATPAASGKSLCYHIPVLESLLADRTTRALYLFPTKALAQDQLRAIKALAPPEGRLRLGTFDGDTPPEERTETRRSGQLVISNPDMLHVGMLPNHRAWGRFLRHLRYVVLDEAHVYRGVFGSHVAAVLRRLRRLGELYGSRPQFILASATIANPGEHAQQLAGVPFTVVEEDGAPFGGKEFALWNPPVTDQAQGTRRSASAEATTLFTHLIRGHTRTIAFVRTRRLAELLHVYARDHLAQAAPELASQVAAYRAGYLPEDRRALERALFEGQLLGVVATNALELGIDIGDLDATIQVGYPGSIASTWQQAGRSGRRGGASLSILVAQDNPLDQYLMRHPEALFGQSTEAARISLENPYILRPHLLCAAYEAPLTPHDAHLFGETLFAQVEALEEDGLLRRRGTRWFLDPGVGYPAEHANIRSTSPEVFTVVDRASGAVLETVDEASALFQVHPGAIYLHQGEPYFIARLDLDAKVAYAQATDAPYHTQTRDITDVRILSTLRERRGGTVQAYLGEVEVSTTVIAFKKKAHYTEEVLAEEYLDLPPRVFRTVALWFDIPQEVLAEVRRARLDLAGGLHAAEHAAIGVLPLFALCDRNDIGGVSTPRHPDTGRPQVFIYDGHPGGVGIAERGYDVIEGLWQATLTAVVECPCQEGCPGCIQSPKCGNNNQPLDKQVAAQVLRGLLGHP